MINTEHNIQVLSVQRGFPVKCQEKCGKYNGNGKVSF